jgi:hypothetical protein
MKGLARNKTKREGGLLKKSLTHAFELRLARRIDALHLPRFQFPAKDEADPNTNECGLFRLLLDVVTRVTLEVAKHAAFRFTSGLHGGASGLTLRTLPNTI